MPVQIQEFDFAQSIPSSKLTATFLDEVRDFFKNTDGGAVPIGSAASALGISKTKMYDLYRLGHVDAIEFATPESKYKTILVPLKEIDRIHRDGIPKAKQGRPKKTA